MKNQATPKRKGLKTKDLRWKKRQPQKTQRGLFKRPPMEKVATLKRKGLKAKDLQWKKRKPQKNANKLIQKTSDEKRGNPEMQGAQNKRPLMEKEATPTHCFDQAII
jgi:hypothetical protein